MQPKPEDYDYDLDRALSSIVGVRTTIPADAFTADTLGTERAGHGVIIRNDGLVLTIGYLVTEAETVWLTLAGGRVVPGHVLGYDQETGFGLVQALARIDVPALKLGVSSKAKVGDHVIVAGAGGRQNAVAARIVAKQEFAGYWEYLLDEAIFTAPSHPHWGGTGLIGPAGELLGIGSLQVQQGGSEGNKQSAIDINMVVPIDLLKPVLDDLATIGRPNKSPRPWLGVFAAEVGDRIVIAGMSRRGPASKSSLRVGDIVMSVAGQDVRGLPTFFRNVWALGSAGAPVPLTINRNGRTMDVTVQSGDRRKFLRGPVLH
ncbi:S1C family serine protease [Hyphomicrobium sp. CS1BSMeth3]|uniref:S1C family serine protease n=1 Tax=Hyphomicrobium sp. CS1BSMeth3 TaxID=1892844 RepID=UPI0009319C6A|nr:S1C family serine protease [Hyphomicrobium sp. CS1BSMeth3]